MRAKIVKPVVATTATLHGLVKAKPNTVIRAFKIVNEGMAPYAHRGTSIVYAVGQKFEELKANTNEHETCARGLNVGTREWCLQAATHEASTVSREHLFMEVEFLRSDVAVFPRGGRGAQYEYRTGKFRVFRFRVISARVLTDMEIDRMQNSWSGSWKRHAVVAPPERKKRVPARKKR